MLAGDTIVARSSPPGRSARGLVRLSGPRAHACVAAVCDARTGARPAGSTVASALRGPPGARTARVLVRLGEGGARDQHGRLVLPALATLFDAPRSATGEDVAELLVPGSPVLIERIVARLLAAGGDGVRRAEAGEFTARAFMNGRIDLTQAEGIARLIAARSEEELRVARDLASGRSGRAVRELGDEVATLLALTEAGIDFTDQEDVVAIAPACLCERVGRAVAAIDGLLVGGPGRDVGQGRPRVVLVGPPNAGKSTLFNALLGRRRAVVSEAEGSTRDVLVEPLDLSGDVIGAGEVDLCDLAGLDETARSDAGTPAGGASRAAAQQAARAAIAGADAIVLCAPDGRFDELGGLIPAEARDRPRIHVRTKADLPGVTPPRTLGVCALDGWRLSSLRRAIADGAWQRSGASARGDVPPRHRSALAEARGGLERVLREVDPSARFLRAPERVAASLREALDALGTITGRTTPDEILGRVFATFCVGK